MSTFEEQGSPIPPHTPTEKIVETNNGVEFSSQAMIPFIETTEQVMIDSATDSTHLLLSTPLEKHPNLS